MIRPYPGTQHVNNALLPRLKLRSTIVRVDPIWIQSQWYRTTPNYNRHTCTLSQNALSSPILFRCVPGNLIPICNIVLELLQYNLLPLKLWHYLPWWPSQYAYTCRTTITLLYTLICSSLSRILALSLEYIGKFASLHLHADNILQRRLKNTSK